MTSEQVVSILLAMLTFFGLILRYLYIRQQRELNKEKARSQIALSNAEELVKQKEEERRIKVMEAEASIERNSQQGDIMIRLIKVMEDRDKRSEENASHYRTVQMEQLTALRNLADAMKGHSEQISHVDTLAQSIKTDLGETTKVVRSAVNELPHMINGQFNPVVGNIGTILLKLESLIARAMDWDTRIGLFIATVDQRVLTVDNSIQVVRSDVTALKNDVITIRDSVKSLRDIVQSIPPAVPDQSSGAVPEDKSDSLLGGIAP